MPGNLSGLYLSSAAVMSAALGFLLLGTFLGVVTALVLAIGNPRASLGDIGLVAMAWMIGVSAGGVLYALVALLTAPIQISPLAHNVALRFALAYLPALPGVVLAVSIGSIGTFGIVGKNERLALKDAA